MKIPKLSKPLGPQILKSICECATANKITPEDVLRLSVGLQSREPILLDCEKIQGSNQINRFLSILAELHAKLPTPFEEAVVTVKGTTRIYFARTEREIFATGNSNTAKKIPGSSWFVSNDINVLLKMNITNELMQKMRFSKEYSSMISGLCESTRASFPWPYSRVLFELEMHSRNGN